MAVFTPINLPHVVDRPHFGLQLAPQAADDAGRQRLVQTEGAADRVHVLTDLQVGRAADRNRLQLAGADVDLEDDDVIIGGDPHHAGLV
jgi:hypothetical protein